MEETRNSSELNFEAIKKAKKKVPIVDIKLKTKADFRKNECLIGFLRNSFAYEIEKINTPTTDKKEKRMEMGA